MSIPSILPDSPGLPSYIPIRIYTDGSCNNLAEVKPIGAGVVIDFEVDGEILRSELGLYVPPNENNTNNRAELIAAISGLWALRSEKITEPVELYSDSEWMVKVMRGEYRASSNLDLIEKLRELSSKLNITWHHVKGHSGHEQNEICDRLANQARVHGGEKRSWVNCRMYFAKTGVILLDDQQTEFTMEAQGQMWQISSRVNSGGSS